MESNPYMYVTGRRFEMKGEGAPRETVSGVIGATHITPKMRILGGLVQDTKPHIKPSPVTVMSEKKAMSEGLQTDRHILGPKPKTHIDGAHYAQVPYAGPYMGPKGHEL